MPEPAAAPAQGEQEESNTQKWIKIGQVCSRVKSHRNGINGKSFLLVANIVDLDTHAARYGMAQPYKAFPKTKLTPRLTFRHR